MTSIEYMKTILLLLVAVIFVSSVSADNKQRRVLKDEGQKLHKQSNRNKRHIIKSIQTEEGDIIDCVDIYKQPAFNHPLLKNHTIQMRIPKLMLPKISDENVSSQIFTRTIECSQGYVPIKRTSEQDLTLHKYFIPLKSNSFDPNYRFYDNMLYYSGLYHGASGHINLWNQGNNNVHIKQRNSLDIWVLSGATDAPTALISGWMVNPLLFHDTRTRFFAYWTTDGSKSTGCFNTLCPGFVQMSRSIFLGYPLKPLSTYDGKQYECIIQIVQDPITKNWWLFVDGIFVGYWPVILIPQLREQSFYITWGGHVATPKGEPSDPMGSGFLPLAGFKRAAFIRQIKVYRPDVFVDPKQRVLINENDLVDPIGDSGTKSTPRNYNIVYKKSKNKEWGHHIYVGGPGGFN